MILKEFLSMNDKPNIMVSIYDGALEHIVLNTVDNIQTKAPNEILEMEVVGFGIRVDYLFIKLGRTSNLVFCGCCGNWVAKNHSTREMFISEEGLMCYYSCGIEELCCSPDEFLGRNSRNICHECIVKRIENKEAANENNNQ